MGIQAMKIIFTICLLVQSIANSESDETIQYLLKRLQKLEEVDQQRQLQFEALQERVIKQEELLKSSCSNGSGDKVRFTPDSHAVRQKKLAVNNSTPIAFNVRMNNEVTDAPAGYILKFNRVKLNEGNGYNPNTGTFTCPQSGLYLFHWTGMPVYGKHFYMNLMINGEYYDHIHADSSQTYQTSSKLGIVRLNTGDRVFLQSSDTASSFRAYYSSFAGVRLSE